MRDDILHSRAFNRATLRSERNRILGLIIIFVVLLIYGILREFTVGTISRGGLVLLAATCVLAVAYECAMLALVVRARRSGNEVSTWWWVLNAIVEPLFPTIAIVVLPRANQFDPYSALSSPVTFVYFFFIILSVLHLSIWLSRLAGLCAALSYGAVTWWVFRTFPDQAPTYERTIYFTFAAFLLLGGLIAGAVADQVRYYVRVSIREASEREQLTRDLDIAREIQQGLLPSEPIEVEGFEIAGWSRPAAETGGDYYDWQRLPDGRVAITIADVTGHGIGSALVTSVCRAYSRASMMAQPDVRQLMQHVNELLVEDLPADRFITFVVAVLDPDASTVELLSAGHGPQLYYAALEGDVQHFGAQGIPLGMMAKFEFDVPKVLELSEGDVLMLLTDGFFEWSDPTGDRFGVERLRDTLATLAHRPAGEIISTLYERVRDHAKGTRQADDVTAVVIKKKRRERPPDSGPNDT